eukprot:Platyproteum_vivax@DN16537_c0_g1_i1.p1
MWKAFDDVKEKVTSAFTGPAAKKFVEEKLAASSIVVFARTTDTTSGPMKKMLEGLGATGMVWVNIDENKQNADAIEKYLKEKTGKPELKLPCTFVNGNTVGGHTELMAAQASGKLKSLMGGAKPAAATSDAATVEPPADEVVAPPAETPAA